METDRHFTHLAPTAQAACSAHRHGHLSGGRVPPVRDLAAEAGVNPNTMQRALAQLEADGLVCSNRTAGRSVTEDEAALTALRRRLAEERIRDYLQSMADLGFSKDEAVQLLENWGEEA